MAQRMDDPGDNDSPASWSEALLFDAADRAFDWHQPGFYPTEPWSPAMNAYIGRSGRSAGRLVVILDLAGVDTQSLEVGVDGSRLVIRGRRAAPEPARVAGETLHMVGMEIDHGSFSRQLPLPEGARVDRMRNEYGDGMLWLEIPLGAVRKKVNP